MRPVDGRSDLIEAAIAGLLDEFFSSSDVSVDWRTMLDDESIDVVLGRLATGQAQISVRFVADGVSQLSPLRPFDSMLCASVLRRALSGGE